MLGLNKSRERAAQIDSNNTPQCIDPDENVLLHYGLDTTRQVLKEYKWFIKKAFLVSMSILIGQGSNFIDGLRSSK